MSMSTMPRCAACASAWITPVTMSPSRPEYSPKVWSCSASRSRCRITCRAVIAATRPKSVGVSSYSSSISPSGPNSCAQTITSPVLRSIATRACGIECAVCLYADSSAVSSASISVLNGISFSRSMLRSAAMSTLTMSVLALVVMVTGAAVELDLHLALAEFAPADLARLTVDVERDAGPVGGRHPAGELLLADRHLHEPAHGTAPVPRLGERTVDTGRADLEH